MSLEYQLGHIGFEKTSTKDGLGLRDAYVAESKGTNTSSSESSARHTVHVIAEEAQERAAIARIIFASGHHAEVYGDFAELVAHRPTVGIVLVHESGERGAASACHILAENGLWLPVIGFGVEVEANKIVAGMKAGAMNYLVGKVSTETLLAKLQECAEEAKFVFEVQSRRASARSVVARLTGRERQVLDLLVIGLSNKEMARQLGISPRTVEVHRMKMMGKISASSSVHAVQIRFDALEGQSGRLAS